VTFIRSIINFLERFDRKAEIHPKPIEQAVKANPVKTKPVSLSHRAEKEITDAINVLFSDGSWFKPTDVANAVNYGKTTIASAISRLTQNGTLESRGNRNDPARAYRLVVSDPTKKCSRCGEIKKHSEYQRNSTSKDGLYNICRQCHTQKDRERREKKLAQKPNPAMKYTLDKFGNVLEVDRIAN
jgi:hypothetical protein